MSVRAAACRYIKEGLEKKQLPTKSANREQALVVKGKVIPPGHRSLQPVPRADVGGEVAAEHRAVRVARDAAAEPPRWPGAEELLEDPSRGATAAQRAGADQSATVAATSDHVHGNTAQL